MPTLQLPKSLEIFLVYSMHSPQRLRGIPVIVKCGEHRGLLTLEKVFSAAPPHFRRGSRTWHGSYTEKGPEEDLGITCNTSGKENVVMVSFRLSCLPQPLPQAPLMVRLSSFLPVQLSWLLSTCACYLVWKKKRYDQQKKKKEEPRSDPQNPSSWSHGIRDSRLSLF